MQTNEARVSPPALRNHYRYIADNPPITQAVIEGDTFSPAANILQHILYCDNNPIQFAIYKYTGAYPETWALRCCCEVMGFSEVL